MEQNQQDPEQFLALPLPIKRYSKSPQNQQNFDFKISHTADTNSQQKLPLIDDFIILEETSELKQQSKSLYDKQLKIQQQNQQQQNKSKRKNSSQNGQEQSRETQHKKKKSFFGKLLSRKKENPLKEQQIDQNQSSSLIQINKVQADNNQTLQESEQNQKVSHDKNQNITNSQDLAFTITHNQPSQIQTEFQIDLTDQLQMINNQQHQNQAPLPLTKLKNVQNVGLNIKEEFEILEPGQYLKRSSNEALMQADFIMIDNYQHKIDADQWRDWIEAGRFDFRQDKQLYTDIQQKVFAGLHLMSKSGRSDAWMIMLGIDEKSEDYRKMICDFHLFIDAQPQNEEDELYSIERDIRKDVLRTFSDLEIFTENNIEEVQERLFKVLKAYSLYNSEVGYMQGLNFLAGMILITVGEESKAFIIMQKLLEIDDWYRLYIDETPKLFELVYIVRYFVQQKLPKLHKHFEVKCLALEPLLASPFFTLFSNLIDINSALQLMERFMLIGADYILDILKQLLETYQSDLLKMDSWDMQVFIGRQIYQKAVEQKVFFVKFQDKYNKQLNVQDERTSFLQGKLKKSKK